MRMSVLVALVVAGMAAEAAAPAAAPPAKASGREELEALRAGLAAQRLVGRPAGWAAELNFAAAHKAEPELAAEVMYDVALAQRDTDRATAAKTLETLLESFPTAQPWAALATYELARACSDRTVNQPKAVEMYERFLRIPKTDPVRRGEATIALARLCQATGKQAQALVGYKAFLEQFPDRPRQCAEALAATGIILIEQKQVKEAYAAYERLVKEYPWDVEQRRNLLLAIAQAFRTGEDAEGAIAAYEKLLVELPKADQRRPQAFTGLAMLYIQKNDTAKAAEVYRRMAADRVLGPSYRASAYRQLFDLQRKVGENAGVIRLAYDIIAAQPSGVLQSGNTLSELVDAFVNEGKVDDALALAKAQCRLAYLAAATHLYTSGRTSDGPGGAAAWGAATQDAIFGVVRALKAKEGSLRAANRFLAFMEFGPEGTDGILGTADDLKDPTAEYHLPADAERDKVFAAAAKRFIAEPYELGYLYLCWDKPHDALRAFRRYYLDCGEAGKLQRAATVLAQAMRALGRPEAEVDAFFNFQNLGPNGKDGRPNTKDDLKDPILALPK
ncbi:MAG: tetratricopeptide repeat protein [Planctomycetes bacterium]|nr:tetratricopeptide repeat protein [Planctomycetota bacterium]